MLPERLTWIDETNRQTYFFLEDDDKCLFFGEFYPSKGWSGGPTNQFIKNFKRGPDEIAESAWPAQLQNHKNRAIREVAAGQIRRELVETRLTFVPIPTSKVVDHPHHCDRLERTLRQAFHGFDADIRLLLRQTVTTEADHRSGGQRIKYDNLLAITEVDPAQSPGASTRAHYTTLTTSL